jgi:hypothetical protein
MTSRERVLTMGLVLLVLAGGGGYFLVSQLYLAPLQQRRAQIAALDKELQTRQDKIDQARANKATLDYWRQISLPPDEDLARREYEKFLSDLMRHHGFAAGAFSVTPRPPDSKSSPTLPGKKPIYTVLTFNVQAHAPVKKLVRALEDFYRTPLLHQIKKVSLIKPVTRRQDQAPDELDINLTVEALVVQGIEQRKHLLPLDRRLLAAQLALIPAALRSPAALAANALLAEPDGGPFAPNKLAHGNRDYAAIAAKDVFFGPPPPSPNTEREYDPARYVYLTDITHNPRHSEAFLYDRLNNQKTRLRSNAAAWGSFSFGKKDETSVQGKLVKIGERDVVLEVEGKFYAIHVGQNLEDALKKPLVAQKDLDALFGDLTSIGGP